METFSALRAPRVGNSPVTGEFPTRSPVKRSFDVFFHLRLNKRLSIQSWGWWFETTSRSLWRHCNVNTGKGNWKVSCSLSFTKSLKRYWYGILSHRKHTKYFCLVSNCGRVCHVKVCTSEFKDTVPNWQVNTHGIRRTQDATTKQYYWTLMI